jgi:hypothetical protein
MILYLHREQSENGYTIGRLWDGGEKLCYTLEDQVREVHNIPVEDWKVKGSTAIPKGTYKIKCDYSERFRRVLPRLLDVPGFSGVRIHAGNTAADTEGCILVGNEWPGGAEIRQSQAALSEVLHRIVTCKEPVTIEVV